MRENSTSPKGASLLLSGLVELSSSISGNRFAGLTIESDIFPDRPVFFGLDNQQSNKMLPLYELTKNSTEPLIIEDVNQDSRTQKFLPELIDGITCYAAFPVKVNNSNIGTLWIANNEPGKPNDATLSALILTAKQIGQVLRIFPPEENYDNRKFQKEEGVGDEKYRSIFENVQEGIFQTTSDGKYISANPKLAQIYGFNTPEELINCFSDIGKDVYEDSDRRSEFINLIQKNDVIHNFESRARRRDGEIIWISENVRAVKNTNNEILYYEGTVIDITEQKRTSEALRESELLYHSLVESIPQNIVRKNLKGEFTFANQKFCQTVNKPIDEILGKTDYDLSPKHLADKYRNDDLRVVKTAETYATTEIHTGAGEAENDIYIETVKTPLFDSSGEINGIQCMFWDVTERHQMEEQLAHEKDLLSALLDNVPDRIYIKDTESRFIKGSTALAKRLGLSSAQEIVGKTDYDFHPDIHAKSFHEDEQRVILTGKPIINKVEKQTDECGRDIWASVTKVPFSNRSGIITGIIGISRDITALKLAEQETARARDLALEAAQMKTRFLAVMSHEIRTPMNGIIGMIDLLLTSDLTEEQHEYAQTVRTSADALLEILNDILDVSKIEADCLELERTNFSLRQVIEEAVELHSLRAEANHIELNCHIPTELDGMYRGDAGRLRQIILNLVSNAVKFTEKGEVQTSVQIIERTNSDTKLQFTVRDTGVGVSETMCEKIFDAFRQADGSITRRYGGTGLGLSISRQLAEMMNGEMWVESQPGLGSKFHFTALLGNPTEEEQPKNIELKDRSLLLIVPNDFARDSIMEYTENMGMTITPSATGAGARRELSKAQKFDLILIDLSLKDADCLDLVQEIHSNAKHKKSKIVLLMTRRHKVDTGMLRTLGINGTLLKPVRLNRLHRALSNALTEKSHEPKVKSIGDENQHRSLKILVAEDNPINQRVATLQLNKLGHQIKICEHGQAVLESDLDKFDIVLMDCQMPVLDGLEATRRIRDQELKNKSTNPMYIIAMTANTQQDDRTACIEAGMDDFISKPVQLNELRTALNKSLGIEPTNNSNDGAPLLLSENHLDQLRGNGQDEDFREIIFMYLEQTSKQISMLHEAFAEQELDSISRISHQIKGSSANMGASQLASACSRLENESKGGNLSVIEHLLKEITGTFDRTEVQLRAIVNE